MTGPFLPPVSLGMKVPRGQVQPPEEGHFWGLFLAVFQFRCLFFMDLVWALSLTGFNSSDLSNS